MKRRGQGYRPKLIFTSDFHQLVNGDLIPGPCLLRYDPHRIVPKDEITGLSKTQRPITAHVRFHPSGQLWERSLLFRPASRLIIDHDPTGQGTMLETEFSLPEDCEELELWFAYLDNQGQQRWDSALGRNYWLRFPIHDLQITHAEIMARNDVALDLFKLTVDSVSSVQSIDVRWRYTTAISDARHERTLKLAAVAERKRWILQENDAGVSSNTPLAFDLVYQVEGNTYTDDNQGTWYVVSR